MLTLLAGTTVVTRAVPLPAAEVVTAYRPPAKPGAPATVTVDLEPGNGGYRFRWALATTSSDQRRRIPDYGRVTPDKVVEHTFG